MRHPLPPDLRSQLDAFRRRLFMQESLFAGAAIVGALAASLVVLFVLDRFFETPHALRLALLALAASVAGLGAWRWLRDWVWHPRDDRRLSLLVQKKYRKLGDTLLGAVELAEGRIEDDTLSPQLREAAIGSVARQASGFDFVRAVAWGRTARFAAGAALGVAGLAVLGVCCSAALRTTLVRWANPFAAAARHTFVRFRPMESPRVVARGEPFTVDCAFTPDSEWKPASVHYQAGALHPGEVAAGRAIAMPGLSEPALLRVWAGDGGASVDIQPKERPGLLGLSARISLPEYLQLPAVESKVGNALTVVEGARVALSGSASRDLGAVSARVRAGAQGAAADPALSPVIAGAAFTLPEVASAQEWRMSIAWTDTLGLSGAAPHEVRVKVRPDALPQVRCTTLAPVTGILAEEVLRIPFHADDDFGIRALSAHVRRVAAKAPDQAPDQAPAPAGPEQVMPVASGAPTMAQMDGEFVFSPKLLGIPEGSAAEFEAGAADYCPAHAVGRSPTHRIVILTRAEHARLIQDRMAELSNQMEELASAEEQRKEAAEALAKNADAALESAESAQKLAEQAASEKGNAQALKKLNEQIQETTRQAMRNKDMPKDLLEKMAQIASDVQKAAEEESPAASDAMESAQGKPGAKERREETKKAAEHQQKVVDALRKNAKELDKVQRQLNAESFINRLRKEATEQTQRVEAAKVMLPKTAGRTPAMLAPEQASALAPLSDGQQKALDALRTIETDLTASFERSHHAPYRAVTDDMEKERAFPRNQEMVAFASNNQLFGMMAEGRKLAALYEAWADKLKGEEGGGGGGGGGGKGAQIPAEVLATIMQLIEDEQDLRTETRGAKSREAAELVGGLQEDVLHHLGGLLYRYTRIPPEEAAVDILDPEMAGKYATLAEGRRPLPAKLVNLLNAAGNAMNDAGGRLKGGSADAQAIAAETEAIEILASVFKEGSGKSGGSPQAGAMMRQMMQRAMAQGKGSSPGQGQTGTGAAKGSGQGTNKSDTGPRAGDQAGGETGGLVPPEFRAQIETYNKEFDQLEGGGK